MRLKIALTWTRLAGLVLLGIAGALFVGWSGLVSIAASSGHWTATRWFLGWTMANAVRTQALLIEKPEGLDLGDPALVRRSAGHFATGCAACHGAPGVPQSPVVQQMVPAPPRLEDKVAEWSDEELFWIVKNGIKFSGMPAWPAQSRDDEVWAQVAFLRALPEMTRREYAVLALGEGPVEPGGGTLAALDGIAGQALNDCSRCHGRDGLGAGQGAGKGAFPVIAGLPEPYLLETLQAFALARRESGFMSPPANRYSAEVLAQLARHYAAQPRPGAQAMPDPVAAPADARSGSWQDTAGVLEAAGEPGHIAPAASHGPPATADQLLELGRRIAVEGVAPQKIPACQSCHGQGGRSRNPLFPTLAGQPEWYLAEHLRLWREGNRGGTRLAHVMDEIARQMTDEQIRAVAAWYAGLPGEQP